AGSEGVPLDEGRVLERAGAELGPREAAGEDGDLSVPIGGQEHLELHVGADEAVDVAVWNRRCPLLIGVPGRGDTGGIDAEGAERQGQGREKRENESSVHGIPSDWRLISLIEAATVLFRTEGSQVKPRCANQPC